jgi:peptidyl-prolyl cis-trans isomerase C
MARPAIKLNGVTLPPQMIAAEAQHHPARSPAAAFQAAARALIIRTLLLEEAARRNMQAVPELVENGKRETEDEAQIRLLLETCLPIGETAEVDCRAYYDSHSDQFYSPELVEASHIFFAIDPRDTDAAPRAEAAVKAALAELADHPDLFESLARERSDCTSKSGGGRLGQLAPGDTVLEFEAELHSLAVGEIAPAPIKTRFGYHILRLDARISGKPLPFSYVQDKIAAFLGERQWRQEAAALIARLVETAQIEGVEMKAGKAIAA